MMSPRVSSGWWLVTRKAKYVVKELGLSASQPPGRRRGLDVESILAQPSAGDPTPLCTEMGKMDKGGE